MLTVPHSGEMVPPEAPWLKQIPDDVLLTDVDRFVDQLYSPVAQRLELPFITTPIHRYAVDLNRTPDDIDPSLVHGAPLPPAQKSGLVSGFHWARTTKGAPLMTQPMTMANHRRLVELYHDLFHETVAQAEGAIIKQFGLPRFHLDLHSMPSQGTGAHRDQGAQRPDVVISDLEGRSCHGSFKDLVIRSYEQQGFSVAYNWPYLGGRMTQRYGQPAQGRHTVQVELNRRLYMDESSRSQLHSFTEVQNRLDGAIAAIVGQLPSLQRLLAGF